MSLKFWANYSFFYPDIERPYSDVVAEAVDIAQAAEDLGFEGIAFPEHHFYNYICNPSALQYATLIGAHTKRLKILTGVLVLPYYHPLALAEEIAQVDHMTKGRLQVGVARGANKFEFDRLGIDWRNARDMYEESLDTITRAWTETDITSEGRFWPFPVTTTIPRPYQDPHPKLWVAAQSENGVRAAGSKGQNMITSPNLGSFAPHGDLEKVLGWYRESNALSGKASGEVMVLRRTFIAQTEERALKELEAVYQHWNYYMSAYKGTPQTEAARFQERTENDDIVLRGGSVVPAEMKIDRSDVYNTYDDPILTTPEKAIARFKTYEDLGVNHIQALMAFGNNVKDVVDSMELMAKEIFPAFADESKPNEEVDVLSPQQA